MIRHPKDRERLHRKVGVVFILVLLLLSFAFPLTNAPSMRSASATRQDYGLESSSGLGTQVKGLVGHVFLGGDGTSESSDQILTSTIKSGTPFKKFMHNGNPTIWGPYDNEVDALPIEYALEGDFVFAVNLEDSVSAPYSFDRMEVWIPPEFQGIKKEHIVASFTDNWGNLPSAIRADVDAITFPNRWTRIRANSDSGLDGLTTGRYIQFGNKSLGDVWAYIRVNKVVAPTIAGKYFFKMGLRVADPIPAGSTANVNAGEMIWLGSPEKPYQTFLSNGVANWPTVTVKSEIDPAYVEGTLRYGGNSGPIYYGQALQLAGRVRLVGRAIDPNTLQPTNRPVEARGYMNASANGHFEIQGVPAGIYDIYASAAGYPEKLIQTNIRILKAQSYHLDGYLTPGVIIDGEVFSKCGTGAINWVTWQDSPDESPAITAQDIKIEIYKLGDVPAAGGGVYEGMQENVDGSSLSLSTQPLAWSPVSTPTKLGSSTGVTAGWGDIPMGFPWPGYGGKYAKGFDPDGVGPPQRWRVESSSSGFRFRFGEKGLYGAPTLLDGHVPQLNATWIDGVAPGSYEVRAFTYGYVQTKADGETFEHVTFSIPAVEFPGDVFVPFDLRLSSYVRKTVHFHDVSGTFAQKPIPGKGQEFRYLYLEVLGVGSTMWGWKVNRVAAGSTSATISSRGIRGQTMSYWGSGSGRDYGFNAGDYVIRAYMYGYVEDIASRIPIGLCGGEIGLSGHMYRGVMFNVTVQSSDWQHPSVNKPWKYPNEYIYLQIGKSGRQLTGYGLNRLMGYEFWAPDGDTFTHDGMTQPNGMIGQVRSSYRIKQGDYVINKLGQSWSTRQTSFAILYYEGQEAYKHTDTDVGYYPTSFDSGQYDLRTLTYGYVMQTDPVTRQVRPIQISATRGALSNIAIRLGVGTQISMMIRFKHEQIFESLRYNSTIRARIFDDKDNLVGEWLTSSSINGTSRPFNSIGQIIKGLPSDSLPAAIGSGTSILGPGYSFAGSGSLGTQVLETVNYVPHGTDQLRITISGLPDPYATGSGALYAGYGFDRAFDVSPWGPGKFGAPGAPYGINGNPWYTGGFYVEVEVVPFGRDVENRHTRLGGSGAVYDGWYPIVQGLLDGESCAADPRTGILFRWSFVPNRISPYQQRVHVPLPGAFMGGESSGVFELDLFGSAIVPVPEYPAPMIVFASALAAVLAVMSRRKRTRHRNRFFGCGKLFFFRLVALIGIRRESTPDAEIRRNPSRVGPNQRA